MVDISTNPDMQASLAEDTTVARKKSLSILEIFLISIFSTALENCLTKLY